ncbi:hypothetical protein ACFVS2_25920 [Brevibacillus sp. NPDC058079]
MPKVVIKEYDTNVVVKEISCDSQREAEKVENGVNRNLNHDQFYTDIEE